MVKFLKDFLVFEDPSLIKKRQYLLAFLVMGFLLGLLMILAFWGNSSERVLPQTSSPQKSKEIESGGSRIKPEEVWRFRMEEENKKMRDALQKIKASLEESQKEAAHKETRSTYAQNLELTLQDLQHQLAQKTAPSSLPSPVAVPQGFPESMPQGTAPSLIQKFTFQNQGEGKPSLKTFRNTIPSGAFVRAVLLSGVDVSTAMTSSQSPRPFLVRMIDHGTLPRKFKSDLKDCHLTGAAHGDLSSERVYARLEMLTCTVRKTGEIIETLVTGYIAGSDGKAGIRGKVVSKDSAFLERSLLGGLFSGLSNIVSPQNRQNMVNPFSAGNPKVDAPSAKDMFTSGMAEGATNALDRLSQYYIRRAEQLQPVIQVPAGQVVDVVFTQAVTFGSQDAKEKIAQLRKASSESSSSLSPSQKQETEENASFPSQTFPPGDAP